MNKEIRILYVDDEPMNLLLFKINFEKKYKIFTAKDAAEGLQVIVKYSEEIIVVISDMNMPQMNGVEFIKKAKEEYPNKRYFILTGFDLNEEIQKAIDTGLIVKYFRKPFNIEEINTAIKEAVAD